MTDRSIDLAMIAAEVRALDLNVVEAFAPGEFHDSARVLSVSVAALVWSTVFAVRWNEL